MLIDKSNTTWSIYNIENNHELTSKHELKRNRKSGNKHESENINKSGSKSLLGRLAGCVMVFCFCLTSCAHVGKNADSSTFSNAIDSISSDMSENNYSTSGDTFYSISSDSSLPKDVSLSNGSISISGSTKQSQPATSTTTATTQYVKLKASAGWTIYRPKAAGGGYRYGPSIILEENGAINAWFSSTGNSEQWDWIKYRRSTDGGKTWTDDKAVLKPTADSEDGYAACDPGVVKIGAYYYIGYTATVNMSGVDNHIFLGRSKNPDGPYEKWNGSGWGGEYPKPIIKFTGTKGQFGAGEPSFVVVGDIIYMYYTWFDKLAYTRISTAPANDPDWPSKLTFKKQIERENVSEDSWDVKYIDEYNIFMSTSIVDRMRVNPSIIVRQSKDGINFQTNQYLKENISEYAHNGGMSGRGDGHIKLSDNNFYSYAYGSAGSWGAWCTLMNPVTISLAKQPDFTKTGVNSIYSFATANYSGMERITDLSAKVCLFRLSTQSEPADIQLVTFTSYDWAVDISRNSNISYSGYDSSIIQVSDHKIIPLKNGSTQITVTYKGFTEIIRVRVGDYWAVKASSNEYFWDRQYLIDNNPTTIFSSTGGQRTEWIEMWKPSAQTIKGMTVIPRGGGENFTTCFLIEYSNDGANWTTIMTQPNYTNPKNNTPITLMFSKSITASHIRFTSLVHGQYFQLAELAPIT